MINTTKDLKQAINEGYDRIEHLKRYTTNSMGTDQGKISSINSLGIVSKILNKKISARLGKGKYSNSKKSLSSTSLFNKIGKNALSSDGIFL